MLVKNALCNYVTNLFGPSEILLLNCQTRLNPEQSKAGFISDEMNVFRYFSRHFGFFLLMVILPTLYAHPSSLGANEEGPFESASLGSPQASHNKPFGIFVK
jgi:hypothetical protein